MNIADLVMLNARQSPDAVAVKASDGSMSYGALDSLANRFTRALSLLGVQQGDRVGIWLEKSSCSIAAMQGVLRLGAVYVLLDPLSPAARIRTIVSDCAIHLLITRQRHVTDLATSTDLPQLVYLCLDDPTAPLNWQGLHILSDAPWETIPVHEDDLAYILYTSGSTGKPKGICISNRNALAFVAWAAAEVNVTQDDYLANHAPFHFDLSVFDLYAAFYRGATVCLIPDEASYIPHLLVRFLLNEAITIWYSVPSVLILMMEQGAFLDVEDHDLRAILFAGEAFLTKHLRRLHGRWPQLRMLNLYGPTETNVCTFYAVTSIPPDQTTPPIGKACSGDQVWAQKEDGSVVRPGEEGELMVTGPTVMLGYWGQPPHHRDAPYATGDMVRLGEDGNYLYLRRRDHMVKIRGHRIEPGDIEAALELHPQIDAAAVVIAGSGIDARLAAFIVPNASPAPTLLEIKRYCAERFPRYMIVDMLHILSELPRTRNGKIDRLQLTQSVQRNSRSAERL